MNYADEEYVRLYTKDTETWLNLGWEGQALLALALRKFEKCGALAFGRRGPVHALTRVTGMPGEVVERAVKVILEEEVWTVRDGEIFWPNYVEAQTCGRSDRLRQQFKRARERSDQSRPVTGSHGSSQPVTGASDPINHEAKTSEKPGSESRPVTGSHGSSQPVTLSPPIPSHPLPSLAADACARTREDSDQEPEPESDHETRCPTTFEPHESAVAEMCEYLKVSPTTLKAISDEFVSFWTIGAGRGKRRSNWQAKFREHCRKMTPGRLAEFQALSEPTSDPDRSRREAEYRRQQEADRKRSEGASPAPANLLDLVRGAIRTTPTKPSGAASPLTATERDRASSGVRTSGAPGASTGQQGAKGAA